MRTVASNGRSSFGTDCVQCGNELIAPERSEYRDRRQIVHLWHCPKCDYCFEVISPADTKPIKGIMTRIEENHHKRRRRSVAVGRTAQFKGSSIKSLPVTNRRAARLGFAGFACSLPSASC